MSLSKKMALLIVGLTVVARCMAVTHYIVPPGTVGATPTDPYTNWATAGTSVIDVVNAAMTNITPRVVWVTNGVYYPTNQLYITNLIAFKSVNGRDATILNGASASTNRCAWFHDVSDCVFDGFTVTNYNAQGQSGTVLADRRVMIINCLFANNSNIYYLIAGSGAGGGIQCMHNWGINTITNCIFRNNWATSYGGGVQGANLRMYGCLFEGNCAQNYYGGGIDITVLANSYNVISNCVIINNSVAYSGAFGAGISAKGATNHVFNCTITGNIAKVSGSYGAGIVAAGNTIIAGCSIIGNVATNLGGGIYGTNLVIRNCLIALNRASTNIGGGIWMSNGIVESCTIVGNYAKVAGGGLYIADPGSSGTNNIIYFNTASSAANFTNTAGNTGLSYSCVIPAVDGAGNTTNNPLLKDLAEGDYRLRMSSPCVNAGTNQDWMTNAVDLEGNARILNNIVDMGAYETILWQGTIYKF